MPPRAARGSRALGRGPSGSRARAHQEEGHTSQAGSRSCRGGRHRAEARVRASARSGGSATTRGAAQRSRRRRRAGREPRPGATRIFLSACRTCRHPAQEAPRRVLHPDERVGCGVRPLAATPAAPRVRSVVVSDGTVQSSSRRATGCMSPTRSPRRAPASSGSCWTQLRKPVAQITCASPSTVARNAEAPRPRSLRERFVPRSSRRIRRCEESGEELGALGAFDRVERVEPSPGEQVARNVERAPCGFVPAHGHDSCSRGKRVQPLGRRRHPGAYDGDVVGVVVRLVGMDDARVAVELVGHRDAGCPSQAARARTRRASRARSRPRWAEHGRCGAGRQRASQPLRTRSSAT